jgi:putative flavoprotein involved in K+ transport
MVEQVETVIVGGGQAGLSLSYYLRQLGQEHVILERARVAERWRSERWDSLMFQFPNWTIQLTGYAYQTDEPDAFAPRDAVVGFLEGYADWIRAPLRCGVSVASLQQGSGPNRFQIGTNDVAYEATNVVVATGPFQEPVIPSFGDAIPADVCQVHTRDYRNPSQLPPGAVLIVGGGASGYQIAEELLAGGRTTYLSVGRHWRVPRRYRGHDFTWWRKLMGAWDQTVGSLPSPAAKRGSGPLVTGANGGYDVDFRRFAGDGGILLGHLRGVDEGKLVFAPDLAENLAEGDRLFLRFTESADEFALRTGVEAPLEDHAPAVISTTNAAASQPITQLDLKTAGITSILWATGFRSDFSWVRLPVFDATGEPAHTRGVTDCPGLYFLGLRWLHKLKSSFLVGGGVGEDAAFIAEQIASPS